MGYETGSIFAYDNKLWLFEDYSTDQERRQTYKLRGVDGLQVEALARDCYFLLSPSEVDFAQIQIELQQ